MTKYILISKCHLQARAKQLETNIFMTISMSLFQHVIYRRVRKESEEIRGGGGEGGREGKTYTRSRNKDILISRRSGMSDLEGTHGSSRRF